MVVSKLLGGRGTGFQGGLGIFRGGPDRPQTAAAMAVSGLKNGVPPPRPTRQRDAIFLNCNGQEPATHTRDAGQAIDLARSAIDRQNYGPSLSTTMSVNSCLPDQ